MEKKGEILNQLAIISDLLEKINLETESRTIVLQLPKKDFEDIFELIQKKYNRRIDKPKNSFSITIGMIDIIFNMSNA
jgi:CRP-like cAMP-binding protein